MTYKIYYIPKGEANCCKDYTMFDIEYYEMPSGKDGEWFSDLSNFLDVRRIRQGRRRYIMAPWTSIRIVSVD